MSPQPDKHVNDRLVLTQNQPERNTDEKAPSRPPRHAAADKP